MEIDYAFLADLAQVSPDGKVGVLGGGVNEILVQSFPGVQQILTLVVRIEAHAVECGREHRLEILFWDPDGNALPPNIDAQFTPQRNVINPTGSSYVQLAILMGQIQLARPGDYAFHILINSNLLKRLPVRVALIPNQPATET